MTMAFLIYSSDDQQEIVSLDDYNRFKIGRTNNNEMTIGDDKSVSREHCEIFRDESKGRYVLKDLESRNGTFLNGSKVSNTEVELKNGDRIMVGAAELVFTMNNPEYDDTTTTSSISKIEISQIRNRDDEEELIQTARMKKYTELDDDKKPPPLELSSSDAISPGTDINGYEIIRVIGSGQYSTVYLAFQKSVNRTVAFKVFNKNYLSKQAPESFLKQIQIIGRLQHPNLLQYFDGGLVGYFCYLSMLYVSEGTLEAKIAHSFPLNEKYVIQVIRKIAEALNYALEEHGLIHLNLRPKNILFSDSGEPVISETGLSSWSSWAYQLNRQNFLGNPSYTSYEQALDLPIDWKADQYTLGIILFECLTGKVPFEGDNTYNLIVKHKQEEIIFPKKINLSEKVKKIILRMTAKKTSERYNSYDEIVKALNSVLTEETAPAGANMRHGTMPPRKPQAKGLPIKQNSSGQKLVSISNVRKKIVPLTFKK